MTEKNKLEKIKKLADDMYYAAANLGPNVGSGERLRKTMEEYHKFIIHEYNKKEPKFKVGDYIKPVDSCLGSPRTIVEVCDSWYVTNQGTIDFEYEDNWELVEKYNITGNKSRHATGKLKECIDLVKKDKFFSSNEGEYLEEETNYCAFSTSRYTDEDRKVLCDGCEEKCEYAQKEADWLQELHCKLDSLSKEELEKVWAKYHQKEETGSEEMEAEFLRAAHNLREKPLLSDWFRHFYLMGKNHQEPVSEDLGEYINELSKQFPEVSFAKLSRIAVRVAKWQKEQFEKNRLKRCNSITNEQAELEQGFIDQHLDKYQRMPTYLDAIEYGMKYAEQQKRMAAW